MHRKASTDEKQPNHDDRNNLTEKQELSTEQLPFLEKALRKSLVDLAKDSPQENKEAEAKEIQVVTQFLLLIDNEPNQSDDLAGQLEGLSISTESEEKEHENSASIAPLPQQNSSATRTNDNSSNQPIAALTDEQILSLRKKFSDTTIKNLKTEYAQALAQGESVAQGWLIETCLTIANIQRPEIRPLPGSSNSSVGEGQTTDPSPATTAISQGSSHIEKCKAATRFVDIKVAALYYLSSAYDLSMQKQAIEKYRSTQYMKEERRISNECMNSLRNLTQQGGVEHNF